MSDDEQIPATPSWWRMLGCAAAITLMIDHAIHVYPDAVAGRLSVAYFTALFAMMLLVGICLSHDLEQLLAWSRSRKLWRRLVDAFFRITRK